MHAEASPFLGIRACTMHDLRARYRNCAASTIYRRIREEDYPKPSRIGRENLWNLRAVEAWEHTHMPEFNKVSTLHVGPSAEDESEWEELRASGPAPSEAGEKTREADSEEIEWKHRADREAAKKARLQAKTHRAERKAEDQHWRALRAKSQGGKPRARKKRRARGNN